jgi:hypothetical protein
MEIRHGLDDSVWFRNRDMKLQLSQAQLWTLQFAATSETADGPHTFWTRHVYYGFYGLKQGRKFQPSASMRAAVSRMLRRLAEQGLIETEGHSGVWKITRAGLTIVRAYQAAQ